MDRGKALYHLAPPPLNSWGGSLTLTLALHVEKEREHQRHDCQIIPMPPSTYLVHTFSGGIIPYRGITAKERQQTILTRLWQHNVSS